MTQPTLDAYDIAGIVVYFMVVVGVGLLVSRFHLLTLRAEVSFN